ncbi:MAG: 50S ribosomal protein L3 [Candidatus Levybacteria bacterium]|nr:50S ribosomal protein L3 [Candidatus Levybacteria bacterium]
MNSLLGIKVEQSQKFLENGLRIPVTKLKVGGNVVAGIKTLDKHSYSAIQLGFGGTKPPFKFLREIRIADGNSSLPDKGEMLKATSLFKPGDVINATGISKGKGYAGVVKRHHFKGGPRTHGQSDRERAPGAIGSTTTPGRVYRGKRMAGRMGHERITIKNLEVVSVDDDFMLVKGLVPGGKNSLLMLKKVGEDKKFVPIHTETQSIPQKETETQKEVKGNAS